MENRPCAVCKTRPANPYRDLCQLCFQAWAANGKNFCARCKAPKEINQFDLCTGCYEAWKIEVNEYEIKELIDSIESITNDNVSDLGDEGQYILHKKSTYVQTPAFHTLCEEYRDLCGVFIVGESIDVGRPIQDPVGDAIAKAPLWQDVPPEQMKGEECSFCLSSLSQDHPVKLTGCTHCFHEECAKSLLGINTSISCPMCSVVTGLITGNQPPGAMIISLNPFTSVSGGPPGEGVIYITYVIPSGTQGPEHKSPGEAFEGTSRMAVFPDTPEGRSIVRMIRTAFRRRLVLTIGQSASRGKDNVVVWGKISHKSRTSGGPENFGYPDPGYFEKVRGELASLGIADE